MRGDELKRRLEFDFRILNEMRCASFDFAAYRTSWDLSKDRNQILASGGNTGDARKYKFILRVPTLVAAKSWSAETIIGVDVDVADYPEQQPNTWVFSGQLPWSPHFKTGAPVCIGSEFWEARKGHVVLGNLVIHLQRLLNWDEKGRGDGYVGWNADAVAYHRDVLGGRPLNSDVMYAKLPHWLGGKSTTSSGFIIEGRSGRTANSGFKIVR